MQNKRIQFRTAVLVPLTCLLLLCALTALAQSGRRVKKSERLPPVPTPEASPTPTPRSSPEQPAIPIFLGASSLDSYGDIPFYFNDSVSKSCAQGLQQRGIHVELSSRDFTRGDAVKRAKEAQAGYVAVLELRSDRRAGDRSSGLSTVSIQYVVFAAGTAKPITSGSVYQQASGLGDIIGRRDSTRVAEERLKNAARVAAGRILSAVLGRKP
ncbi:MAG: hypothetical protein ACR2LM_19300 [Pyrinomonadaceae bacterium]